VYRIWPYAKQQAEEAEHHQPFDVMRIGMIERVLDRL
jgi:hypothetical protein